MKHRIWLATALLLLAALGVLAFQSYWTYQTYQQATRHLRQDGQAALAATGQRAVAAQTERLLGYYAQWLQDTTRVRLSCRLNRAGRTEFTVAGVPARPGDKVSLSFEDYEPHLAHLTPAARTLFIRRFVQGTVRRELAQGYVLFHTQWLGRQLDSAMHSSWASAAEFGYLLTDELKSRGLVGLPFRLQLTAPPAPAQRAPAGFPLALTPVRFGLRQPAGQVARAWLPAAPGVVLGQLQGVLLASGALLLLVLGCGGYAVATMQRQKQLAALKADFTNNMTHELKTPVATIQLAADSLRHFELDAKTTAEYAALIGEQAGQLGGLIDCILRSVALEQNALPLSRQPLAWPEVAAQLVAQQQPQFTRAGRQLHWVAAPPATILGDATHLRSALATLLDNALKYGGPVVSLRSELLPDAVVLHLTDNGPGIPSEHQEQVFEQFFRVPTGDIHAVKGYGLGLHYARQVARAHGGALTLRSRPGQDTTFTFSLPLAG